MANLFYPQLLSGALAQYPIRKVAAVRTIQNALPNGSFVVGPDPGASRMVWQLSYTGLNDADLQALQSHFAACAGPLRGFTFIDPTDNMLGWSTDLTASIWMRDPLLSITRDVTDPLGANGAFQLSNTGNASQRITQAIHTPSGYTYSFSIYVRSNQPTAVLLLRNGSAAQAADSVALGPNWSRVVASGTLQDKGQGISVGLDLMPGQQVEVYGPQLEPQPAPSRYRATAQAGGVYANAHWASSTLAISADGPHLFSVPAEIETYI